MWGTSNNNDKPEEELKEPNHQSNSNSYSTADELIDNPVGGVKNLAANAAVDNFQYDTIAEQKRNIEIVQDLFK